MTGLRRALPILRGGNVEARHSWYRKMSLEGGGGFTLVDIILEKKGNEILLSVEIFSSLQILSLQGWKIGFHEHARAK